MNYCINAAWHGGNQPVAPPDVMKPGCFDSGLRVSWFVGLGLTIHHRLSMGFRSGEFAGQSSTLITMVIEQAFGTFCGQVPSPAGKWIQHLHKAYQQKKAWNALKCPGRWLRWLWTSENTVYQHQQMTWQPKSSLTVETSHWTSSNWILCLSTLPDWDLFSKWNAKFTFIWKEDFGPLATVQFFFLSPCKMLLTMFLFQKWLVALFLKMSERGDSWCTLQFQFTPCEDLPSVWIGFAWQYSQACVIPVACAHCPTQFLPSSQLCINMLWYSTHWTATLSVMTLCDLPSLWRVLIIVFWIIAKSAVFPIIVVSKRYPEFILYGCHLLNSNVNI